jgi:hypothetical protein
VFNGVGQDIYQITLWFEGKEYLERRFNLAELDIVLERYVDLADQLENSPMV